MSEHRSPTTSAQSGACNEFSSPQSMSQGSTSNDLGDNSGIVTSNIAGQGIRIGNTIRNSTTLGNSNNILSLAATNFNFSMTILPPPKDFVGLGASLSIFRRNEAETGACHITARKLGALFDQILRPPENLIKVYGQRVSHISASPSTNPRGSLLDGIFQRQVGIDGTAIWAAATSGRAAIAVNLLACMLARLWPGSEATSIWYELVIARKAEITKQYDGTEPTHVAPLQAAMEQISRKELAEWDASARSWLRSADRVMEREQKQLNLIVNNLALEVDLNNKVYESVLRACQTAMDTLGRLISGMPHRVHNGAILLGLSAWHIYPDMVVLGVVEKRVRQRDPLVASEGYITIGLSNSSPTGDGVYWSLSLAHLRYYGAPVLSRRAAGSDGARVPFKHFRFAALGAFLAGWEDFVDIETGARLLNAIWNCLSRDTQKASEDDARLKALRDNVLNSPNWLACLCSAAHDMIELEEVNHEEAVQLAKTGSRKLGSSFFHKAKHPCVVFNFNSVRTLMKLIDGNEDRIRFLRILAKEAAIGGVNLVIGYRHSKTGVFNIASVLPHKELSRTGKRNRDGSLKSTQIYKRWVTFDREEKFSFCVCNVCSNECPCRAQSFSCGKDCHKFDKHADLCGNQMCDSTHHNFVQNDRKEIFHELEHDSISISDDKLSFSWYNIPGVMIHNEADAIAASVKDDKLEKTSSPKSNGPISEASNETDTDVQRNDFEDSLLYVEPCLNPDGTSYTGVDDEMLDWENTVLELDKIYNHRTFKFSLLIGDPDTAAVYVMDSEPQLTEEMNGKLENLLNLEVQAEDIIKLLDSNLIDSHKLVEHIHGIWKDSERDSIQYLRSLKAFATADMVYKLLPDATVALKVIGRTLWESLWCPTENADGNPYNSFSCTRAQAFSLVSMFETGTLNISPDSLVNVMALATGDSIYVAAPLVCDPKETPSKFELRRIVGNIGRPGVAMLLPPESPRVREPSVDSWKFVPHLDFDGKATNSYQGTSVHLAFTGYDQPVMGIGSHGAQDVEAYFLEALVSVEDRGKWVADLDILSALNDLRFHRIGTKDCRHDQTLDKSPFLVTAIDSWDELLDRPRNAGIVRAHENWLARLALTSVSIQCQYETLLLADCPCWQCCLEMLPNIKKKKEFSSIILIY